MGDGLNKVLLLGNLGTEPEVRYTNTGTAVLHFRMATNESFLDRNRDLAEHTEWHNVVMFGPRASGIARFLSKGQALLVEGSLRTSTFEKDGRRHHRTEIHAHDVCFAGSSSRVTQAIDTHEQSPARGPVQDLPVHEMCVHDTREESRPCETVQDAEPHEKPPRPNDVPQTDNPPLPKKQARRRRRKSTAHQEGVA